MDRVQGSYHSDGGSGLFPLVMYSNMLIGHGHCNQSQQDQFVA